MERWSSLPHAFSDAYAQMQDKLEVALGFYEFEDNVCGTVRIGMHARGCVRACVCA